MENQKKEKLLCIMQLPPPVHGQSMVNSFIYQSKIINNSYNIRTIPLQFTTLEEIGRFSFGKIFKMIAYFFKILYEILFFRPKAVYFTITHIGSPFYRDCLFVLLLKILNQKIIYHLHGKGISEQLDNRFKRFLYRLVFNKTDVITLAPGLIFDIKNIPAKFKIHILPNGLPDKSDSISDDSIIRQQPKLLFLSNLGLTKGILIMLEAVKILQDRAIDFKIDLVGGFAKPFLRDDFDQVVQNSGIAKSVNYLGTKFGDEKNEILKQVDIFVLPTFNDCFPLVILEAMQAGLPVVSTFEGAIPDIVDDGVTGFLVPQKDARALADKLEILIKNPTLCKQLGNAGRTKFLEKYTLDKFENNLLVIFDKIINS